MSDNAIDFPLHLGAAGHAARPATRDVAVEQLIEELLFTALGERLNRPELGCGLLQLVFEPESDELRAATQFQVATELQRWLGDVIRVSSVVAASDGTQLSVTVAFTPIAGGAPRTAVFVR